jgi:hypothetical protein
MYLVAYYNSMTIFFFDLASLHRLELPHPSELLGSPPPPQCLESPLSSSRLAGNDAYVKFDALFKFDAMYVHSHC